MAATTITLRNTKGSPLTNTEMDTNISLLNNYSKGYLSKSISTSITLTDAEADNYFFAISGTLTSNVTITIPSILVKSWTVHNGTTGGFSITVKYTTGAGITVLNATRATFYFDGTDMKSISYSNAVNISDTGTVTNTMLAGSIANAKLVNSTISGVSLGSNLNALTIGTGLSGTSYNGSSAVTIAIDSTVALRADVHYIGTTSVALNRASANLALTGISSVTLPGSTSGSVQLIPTAAVGTGTILTIPAVTGTIVTTGDSGTVTNTMLAGSIANAKLVSSTISGISLGSNLNTLTISSPLTGTSYNGSGAVSIGIPAATSAANGYMTAAYAGKVDGLSYGAIAEIGRYIDFHGTAGTVNDFDVRFDCGPSGVSGQGTLSVTAGNVSFNSNVSATTFTGAWAYMPAGTRVPFAQAAAPTGWTQDVTENANDRMLRVVNTAGGGVAGSHSPILNNVVPNHTHGFSTGNVSADHIHNDAGHTHGYTRYSSLTQGGPNATPIWYGTSTAGVTATGYASIGGASANHTHSGTTDNGSSGTNWTPRYINMIICSKN
jgi:hypothetical protein